MRVALLKLPGVESAVVSLEKAEADIRLKPDNRLTLPQLREVLKKNGYPTRDAQIEARGQLVESSGTRVFDLLNGSTLDVETGGAAVPSDRAVDVTGVTRAEGRARERLRVLSVR